MTTSRPDPAAHPIILYDGVCALCNWLVTFVLARDRAATFRFASLQSELARQSIARHGGRQGDLDTMIVVVNPGLATERLLARSDAALFALGKLSGTWRLAASLGRTLPRFLRDWTYDRVARHRYQVFGRYDACPLPPPQHRDRFLS